jgi:hypothetical protein
MGTSRGTATFTDGEKMYLDYQNTSDQVISGLSPGVDTQKPIKAQPAIQLTKQPWLADINIDYGSGLNWTAWCSDTRNQIIINLSKDGAFDFSQSYSYGLEEAGNAHLVKEVSGFGYSSSDPLCGYDRQINEVAVNDAEGRLCLDCMNAHLGLKKG